MICTETLSKDLIWLRRTVCPELSGAADEAQLQDRDSPLQVHVGRSVEYTISPELREALYAKWPEDKQIHDHYCACRVSAGRCDRDAHHRNRNHPPLRPATCAVER